MYLGNLDLPLSSENQLKPASPLGMKDCIVFQMYVLWSTILFGRYGRFYQLKKLFVLLPNLKTNVLHQRYYNLTIIV